jgi:methylmalonyl-CoA mutase, C-terminal domain
MEVIYLGPWAEIPTVVEAAVQEDADVVGVSSLAYDHLIVPELVKELRSVGYDGEVLVGGTVQAPDIQLLEEAGVARVFHPGEPLVDIVNHIRAAVRARRRSARDHSD